MQSVIFALFIFFVKSTHECVNEYTHEYSHEYTHGCIHVYISNLMQKHFKFALLSELMNALTYS